MNFKHTHKQGAPPPPQYDSHQLHQAHLRHSLKSSKYLSKLLTFFIYFPLVFILALMTTNLGITLIKQGYFLLLLLLGIASILYRYGFDTLRQNLKNSAFIYIMVGLVAIVAWLKFIDIGTTYINTTYGYRVAYLAGLKSLGLSVIYLALLPYSRISYAFISATLLFAGVMSGIFIAPYWSAQAGFYGIYNRVIYAETIALLFPMALIIAIFLKNSTARFLAIIAATILFLDIAASQCRGVMLPSFCLFIFGICYVLFFNSTLSRKVLGKRALKVKASIFIAALLILLAGYFLASSRLDYSLYEVRKLDANSRALLKEGGFKAGELKAGELKAGLLLDATRVAPNFLYQVKYPSSIEQRFIYWLLGYNLIKQHSEILLRGLRQNPSILLAIAYKNGILTSEYWKDSSFSHFHNQYLDALIRYGILGLLFLLLLVFGPAFMVARGNFRAESNKVVERNCINPIMKKAIYATTFMVAVCLLSDVPLIYMINLVMYFAIMMLGLNVRR